MTAYARDANSNAIVLYMQPAGLRREVVYQPRNDADSTTVARHDCLTSVQGQSGSFQRTVVSKLCEIF